MEMLNDVATGWWRWMGPMLWQVSLLIFLVSSLDILLRRWAWPQVRYALWLLVLVKLVIPPSWSLPSSVVSHIQPRIAQTLITDPTAATQAGGLHRGARAGRTSLPLPTAASSQNPALSESPALSQNVSPTIRPVWQLYTMSVWMVGMMLFLGLLVVKMIRLRRWHQRQKEKSIPQWFHELLVQMAQRIKMQRLPAIVFSKNAVCPAVYGLLRPVLLLPADYFDHLSHHEAEHVLLHELAHLKRGDLWLHGLCLFLQIVYWFNPLVMWMRRQMKHVREICCDLTVANILREKTMEYRQTLLNTARKMLTETVEPGLGLLGVFEEPFRLVSRLKWLEKKTWNYRTVMMITAGCVILFMTAFVMPMAGIQDESAEGETMLINQNNLRVSMDSLASALQTIC